MFPQPEQLGIRTAITVLAWQKLSLSGIAPCHSSATACETQIHSLELASRGPGLRQRLLARNGLSTNVKAFRDEGSRQLAPSQGRGVCAAMQLRLHRPVAERIHAFYGPSSP